MLRLRRGCVCSVSIGIFADGIQQAFTADEVIKSLENTQKQYINGWYYIPIRPALRNRIIELLEMQKPREAQYVGRDGIMRWECPRCKNPIDMFYTGEQTNYCHHCGQKLTF